MQYKKYIVLLFISGLFSQSVFNRIFPEEYYPGDAKSMGAGHSYLAFSNSSKLVLTNPAKLSRISRSVDFNINISSIAERRSRIIKDNWGDFLAETDYVFNKHNFVSKSLGFILGGRLFNKEKFKFGFGYHYSPIYSLNYNYDEEVRSDADLEDAIVGISDPIIGYHIFKNSGDIAVHSVGFSLFNESYKYALGFSINQVQSTEIKDEIFVNLIDPSYYINNNIAETQELDNSYSIEGCEHECHNPVFAVLGNKKFHTISLEFINDDIEFTFAYEEDYRIKTNTSNSIQLSPHTGLPLLFEMNSVNELEYLISGLNFKKPKKISFGVLYNPKNSKQLSIAFETTERMWDLDFIDSNIREYRFGFSFQPFKSFPIRSGLVYSESLLTDPKTIITLGTGRKFGKHVAFDIAANYSTFKYYNYDLFPENDIFNMSCESIQCDKITENRLNLLTTVRVTF